MHKRILLIFILIFSIAFSINAFGDLGNFNDYDSSSGWDSSDWSSDWDSDFGSDWDDDDDDYYYGGNSNYYSGGGGSSSSSDIPLAVIIVIIILVVSFSRNKNKGNMTSTSSSPSVPVNGGEIKDNTAEIVKEIINVDPDFSEERFMAWAKEVFITLQTAWSKREWDSVRPFEKEELYRQHQLQIQEYIDNGRINVIERININNAHFFEYKRDNQYEYLTVFMKTRMVDYIKDEKTGAVLKGNPNVDCYPRYLLTFMRKKGVLTNVDVSNKSVTNCPNCGAPTQITSAGKCEYCESVITTGDYDWVLSDIQGVKKTVSYGDGGIRINE